MVLSGTGTNQTRLFALYDPSVPIFAFASFDLLSVWTSGPFYSGPPRPGGLDKGVKTPPWVGQLNQSAGRYFPVAWAYFVLDHPGRVESVTATERGGWRAVLRLDPAAEGQPDELNAVTFDKDGLVTQVQAVTGQAKPYEYSYRTDHAASWMVLSEDSIAANIGPYTAEQIRIAQPAPMGASDFAYIERQAQEADVDIHSWPMEKVQAQRNARGLAPLQSAPNIQRGLADAKGEWTPWRWPLIAGGAIVLGIAGYGLWRRKVG